MVLIIMHHVFYWIGITQGVSTNESNLMKMLGAGGKIGVNVFILISAYFMVNKPFKWKRILQTVLTTTFYSITIYLIFLIWGGVPFARKDLVFALLPVFYKQWDFVTMYVALMFLSPALNIILKTVSQKT